MLQRAVVTPKPERIKAAAEYLQSGKTMIAWSKEQQINRFTLQNWVDEYRQESKPAVQSSKWLELRVNGTTDAIDEGNETVSKPDNGYFTPIRISIGNTQIEVTTSFDETALAAVIKAVKCQC